MLFVVHSVLLHKPPNAVACSVVAVGSPGAYIEQVREVAIVVIRFDVCCPVGTGRDEGAEDPAGVTWHRTPDNHGRVAIL
jgi:hypothetical protein